MEINENTKLLAYIWRFWRIGKLNRVLSKVNRHYSGFFSAPYSKNILTAQKMMRACVRVGVVWLSHRKAFTAWSKRSVLFHVKRNRESSRWEENASECCVGSIALVAYAVGICVSARMFRNRTEIRRFNGLKLKRQKATNERVRECEQESERERKNVPLLPTDYVSDINSLNDCSKNQFDIDGWLGRLYFWNYYLLNHS